MEPVFLSDKELQELLATNQYVIVDDLKEAEEDLFKIDFPYISPGTPEYQETLKTYIAERKQREDASQWVLFPWRKTIVHLPVEEEFFKLRTARNKFLITEEEQKTFNDSVIGIAGLSVGSSVLNAIVLSGGPGKIKIADNDKLSLTNLNRLYASVCDLGQSKIEIAARRTFEINPYQELMQFSDGLHKDNLNNFLEGLDLYIEEVDDIQIKILSRFKARELKIPVIMATDNGDNTIVDVERFDKEPLRPLFHGRVSESVLENVSAKPSPTERVRLASAIVGYDITPRTMSSLMLVGSKIPTWPQLGNAANLSGVAASYVARMILTGENMPSGRYYINLDSALDVNYHGKKHVEKREQQKEIFVKSFQILFSEK